MPKANGGRCMPSSVPLTRFGITSATRATVGRTSTLRPAPSAKVSAHGRMFRTGLLPPANAARQQQFEVAGEITLEIILSVHREAQRRVERLAILLGEKMVSGSQFDHPAGNAGRAIGAYFPISGYSIAKAE